MNTELENIQQQVSALQENTDLITQDIVRIMPTIVSLLSENEKKMQEFHEMRAKDQELLQQIKQFIKRENDVLSKIINDYGTLQDVANEISTITRQELAVLTIKEKDIVSKIAEIPDQVIVKHHYGIDPQINTSDHCYDSIIYHYFARSRCSIREEQTIRR